MAKVETMTPIESVWIKIREDYYVDKNGNDQSISGGLWLGCGQRKSSPVTLNRLHASETGNISL